MILTGKAAEYAEEFEVMDKEIQLNFPDHKLIELTERDQINLFQIMMMFERDEVFKSFISGCLCLFEERAIKGPEALCDLIDKISKIQGGDD